MSFSLVAFSEEHLPEAARLLLARHQRDCAKEPLLPASLATLEACHAAISNDFEARGALGVVALRDGEMLGFLLGALHFPDPWSAEALFARPRTARIGYTSFAIAPEEDARTLIRALYAALAPLFLKVGCFFHEVQIPAWDQEILSAWSFLGFGVEGCFGARRLEDAIAPPAAAESALEIRRATEEDEDTVARLVVANLRYQSSSPAFRPYLPEARGDLEALCQSLLSDPKAVAWLATREESVLGLMTLFPHPKSLVTPPEAAYLQHAFVVPDARGQGVGGALLAKSLEDLRARGFSHCAVSWFSASLLADRFFRKHGFRPLSYRLSRQIDERIAWAK